MNKKHEKSISSSADVKTPLTQKVLGECRRLGQPNGLFVSNIGLIVVHLITNNLFVSK